MHLFVVPINTLKQKKTLSNRNSSFKKMIITIIFEIKIKLVDLTKLTNLTKH